MSDNRQTLSELIFELEHPATLPDAPALSLPPAAYSSDTFFDLEITTIFEHEWVPLGRVEEISQPGDFLTTELAGDPLLVVRGDDGKVRVLSNVCRHKWTEVAKGQGNARVFVCPYHAWTYGRDGALIGARFMDRTGEFSVEDCRLPELRSEIWGGFVLVNLDVEAKPLSARLESVQRGVGARYAGRGRVSWLETSNVHFGRYIARKLTETAPRS